MPGRGTAVSTWPAPPFLRPARPGPRSHRGGVMAWPPRNNRDREDHADEIPRDRAARGVPQRARVSALAGCGEPEKGTPNRADIGEEVNRGEQDAKELDCKAVGTTHCIDQPRQHAMGELLTPSAHVLPEPFREIQNRVRAQSRFCSNQARSFTIRFSLSMMPGQAAAGRSVSR